MMRRTDIAASRSARAAILAAIGATGFQAQAQWTVIDLHPPWAMASVATSVDGGQQVGGAFLGFTNHALLWTGSAASVVDLHPGGQVSHAYGVSGGIQCGYVADSVIRAGYWTGTPASWVDMHPPSTAASEALAVHGGQFVGTTGLQQGAGTPPHRAALWTGTAASWVDLHPAGATSSRANAVHAGQQGGQAFIGGVTRAGIWTGSAASWVDLHPVGATYSVVTDIHNGVQVGYTYRTSSFNPQRAALWTGTAASWVDLNPDFATSSGAFGVCNGRQVGYVRVNGSSRACLWTGSAESVVDLHAQLPPWPPVESSSASDITENGALTIVLGGGWVGSQNHAMMWTLTSPCYADCDRSTSVTANDFTCFFNAFAADEGYANCDMSTGSPLLTANDFVCFVNAYAAGCS